VWAGKEPCTPPEVPPQVSSRGCASRAFDRPGFDEVDPARDVHATSDLVVLADAVGKQPVDGQDARLDATSRQSRVQLRLGPIQRLLDLRHRVDRTRRNQKFGPPRLGLRVGLRLGLSCGKTPCQARPDLAGGRPGDRPNESCVQLKQRPTMRDS